MSHMETLDIEVELFGKYYNLAHEGAVETLLCGLSTQAKAYVLSRNDKLVALRLYIREGYVQYMRGLGLLVLLNDDAFIFVNKDYKLSFAQYNFKKGVDSRGLLGLFGLISSQPCSEVVVLKGLDDRQEKALVEFADTMGLYSEYYSQFSWVVARDEVAYSNEC